MKELTKELYDRFPKVWEKLKDKYDVKRVGMALLYFYDNGSIFQDGYILPFNFLYALLEDFFEENGLIITTKYYSRRSMFSYCIHDLTINNMWDKSYWEELSKYNTKPEAKYQAVLKACEIYENILSEEQV